MVVLIFLWKGHCKPLELCPTPKTNHLRIFMAKDKILKKHTCTSPWLAVSNNVNLMGETEDSNCVTLDISSEFTCKILPAKQI